MAKIKSSFLILFLFIFTSCLSNGSKTLDNLEGSTGNLRVLATDAPFNYSTVTAANITVSEINVLSADGAQKLVIMDSKKTLNLIDLKNGLVSTLAELNIPSGDYSELRLVIESASVELNDGRIFHLTVPSGAQSGLKVKLSPAIVVSERLSSDVLLDFDLSRSFVPQGSENGSGDGITGFHFKPVIRAANLTTSGSVKGVVSTDSGTPTDYNDDTPLEGATVTVSRDGAVVSTAVTEASGFYQIIGLPEGTYSIETSSELHTGSESQTVTINAGNVTEENVLLELTSVN